MVRGVKLEIPVLVFGDDLESVLQWDAHVGSNSPLRVECRDRILRFVPIVPNSGGHIIIERPATPRRMHPCCQNVSESEWSGTHPHRQVWYHARIAILPEA